MERRTKSCVFANVFAYSFIACFSFLCPYLPSNWLNYLQGLLGVRNKNVAEFV